MSNITDVVVEVLTSSACARCQRAKTMVQQVIADCDDERIRYHEVDVVEAIDYAVQLGILRVPAIAINGELVFSALPKPQALQDAIVKRLGK